MGATPMPLTNNVLKLCQQQMPEVSFRSGRSFYWSPRTNTVFFDPSLLDTPNGRMALLHETSHAELNHKHYVFDSELVQLEATAWDRAIQKAKDWSLEIDSAHIEECLDTYREWLYARSTCPTCGVNAPQTAPSQYKCLNCSTNWSVSPSRFCRPYRMRLRNQKIPSSQDQTVFE